MDLAHTDYIKFDVKEVLPSCNLQGWAPSGPLEVIHHEATPCGMCKSKFHMDCCHAERVYSHESLERIHNGPHVFHRLA